MRLLTKDYDYPVLRYFYIFLSVDIRRVLLKFRIIKTIFTWIWEGKFGYWNGEYVGCCQKGSFSVGIIPLQFSKFCRSIVHISWMCILLGFLIIKKKSSCFLQNIESRVSNFFMIGSVYQFRNAVHTTTKTVWCLSESFSFVKNFIWNHNCLALKQIGKVIHCLVIKQ